MKKFNKRKLLYLIPIILLLIMILIIGQELLSVLPHLKTAENENIKEYLTSFGLKGAVFIIIMQTIQMLSCIIPSGFIQIAAGITYGTILGGLLCSIGLIIGASIIYMLANIFKINSNDLFKNDNKLKELQKVKKAKTTKLLFLLFLIPAVSYGIICYYGATQKLTYRRFITICTLGSIPSIYLSSLLGNILLESIGNNFKTVIFIILALLILPLFITNKLTKKKKIELGIQNKLRTRKPSAFLYYLLSLIIFPYFKIKNNVKINNNEIKKLKGPYLMLCNHPSRPDFIYSLMSVYPTRVNVVAARYYFYNKTLSPLLKKLGVIPKNLFNPDIETIKSIMNVIKNDGIVLMMPEGRLSASGELEKMPEGVEKLIKKLNVPVVAINVKGAHLTGAKWMKKRRKGKIVIDSKVILTKEEIINNNENYIHNKVKENISYNDYSWNEKEKIEYKGKDMLDGIENLLYICPHCHKEFSLSSNKNTITCNNCNKTYEMDNYYTFKNEKEIKNINDWFNYQKEYEKQRITNNNNYILKTEVILKMPNKKCNNLVETGKGICSLNKNELTYVGTINGETTTKNFNIKNIPALPFACNENFEIYADNTYYYFSPKENKKQCVKWSICEEIIHDLNKESI